MTERLEWGFLVFDGRLGHNGYAIQKSQTYLKIRSLSNQVLTPLINFSCIVE